MKYLLSLIISGALVVSGFGQTRNVLVNTNNAVVQPTNFWSADASNARTGLGLGATNTVTFKQLAIGSDLVFGDTTTTWSGNNRINYEELRLQGGSWQIDNGSLIIGGGTNQSLYQAQTRTNLGLGAGSAVTFDTVNAKLHAGESNTIIFQSAISFDDIYSEDIEAITRTNLGLGWSALTNTDATNFRSAIELGTTNDVQFNSIKDGSGDLMFSNGVIYWGTNAVFEPETSNFENAVGFSQPDATRTNLGLPWSGLTNTNAATFQAALFGAGTNLVLVDSNGEVVSPTNFWQAAPITTTFIESQPTTNSTNNVTAARFLHIHSLNTNIVNVTNTIALPTNGSTYNGDVALIVHQGLTNSMTRVRAAGSTNDIATMTRYNEAIEFVYYNNDWTFNHNQAFTEPVYFAGTNAAGHAAESRTNLGLGATNDVSFNSVAVTNSYLTRSNLGLVGTGTNSSIGGGYSNSAIGIYSTVAGGQFCEASDDSTSIGGGWANFATNYASTIAGGGQNSATGELATIGGGYTNLASGELSTIIGGEDNVASGLGSTIAGGVTNTASGDYSFAAGQRAKATNNGAFVWADQTASDFVSTGDNTFNVRASGGVYLNMGTNGISFANSTNSAVTRTNLGIPLAALTNTNNANFQAAVFNTNAAPTPSVNFGDAVAWLEITVQTNGTNASFRIPLYEP